MPPRVPRETLAQAKGRSESRVRQVRAQLFFPPGAAVLSGLATSDVVPWQCLARYPQLCQGVTFVDVDFPDLMAEKRRIVSETLALSAPLTNLELCETSPVLLRSREYCQIGCDLRQLHVLELALSEVVPLGDAELFFLGEVSLAYLDASSADAIIRKSTLVIGAD